jgi:hypothetical protein
MSVRIARNLAMRRKLKIRPAAALVWLVVLFGAAPAVAADCTVAGCDTGVIVRPKGHPTQFYHIGRGPDHDYSPMYFYDGHGGYIYGQWLWGGVAWRYIRPRNDGSDGWR